MLGENHPETLWVMHNLAALYDKLGQYDKAHPLYIKCLEKRKSILDEYHPDTLDSLDNLAAVSLKLGE